MSRITELDKKYIAGTYARFPVEALSGKGEILRDGDGKEYIDLGAGIGVNTFGYSDTVWVNAVESQLSKIQHSSNLYYTEPAARLAEKLCTRTGMKKVFFSNSGAEANECAIKTARLWAEKNKGEDSFRIITLKNSFHGRTVATLEATGQDKFHSHFGPFTGGFGYAAAGDEKELEELTRDGKAAAVMFEIIQGEGGVVPLSEPFVKKICELSERYGFLVIVDEVQTGNGRTGKLYSYMNYGIKPDIITTAKGLGGGLPIGATLFGEKTENVLGSGDHGSTFGANPVSCAGAVSIIDRLDDAFLESVMEKSRYVFETLKGAPGIEDVCGMGLMIGIKPEGNASEIVKKCIDEGILPLTAKDRIRLLPPLSISMESLEKALGIIKKICAEDVKAGE